MSVVIQQQQNNLVISDTNDSTAITGTTTNTLSGSYLISGGKLKVGDILELSLLSDKTGTNGVTTIRTYINTSASLSGATLLSTTTTTLATNISNSLSRLIGVKASNDTRATSVSVSYWGGENTFTISNALNIDWTTNQYLIVAFQNGSTLDSTKCSFITLEKI